MKRSTNEEGDPVPSSSLSCRLLTSMVSTISGWHLYNKENWVDPDQWKESWATSYRCFEKVVSNEY